ncbi:unnamed protein product, partial [Candidula unifasciata]
LACYILRYRGQFQVCSSVEYEVFELAHESTAASTQKKQANVQENSRTERKKTKLYKQLTCLQNKICCKRDYF